MVQQTKIIEWKGIEETIKNINSEIKKINNRTASGLISAALYIKGEAVQICPVVTGNLQNSAYVIGPAPSGWMEKAIVAEGGIPNNFHGTSQQAEKARVDHNAAVQESKQIVGNSSILMSVIGFSASYAAFVHENPRAGKTGGQSPTGKIYKPEKGSKRKVYSTRKAGRWKFLEEPLVKHKKKILDTIKKKAEIK